MVENLRVFRHVGFLFSVLHTRPSAGPGQSQKGRLIMYIGGGLLTLVVVVLVVVFLVRGF